jgi:nucleotide-binding universal stress UspA family protein
MFKRILVAVDASPTGERALQTAIGLAAASQARLRIVHAVDTANVNFGTAELPGRPDMAESLVRNGQDILRGAEAAAAAAGIAFESGLLRIDTLDQRIAEAVAHEAETWPADLIVVGTHGRRGLSRLFLGSVAEGIARVATRPVLLVRGK